MEGFINWGYILSITCTLLVRGLCKNSMVIGRDHSLAVFIPVGQVYSMALSTPFCLGC